MAQYSLQDDLVVLSKKLAASLGGIGQLCLVLRVTDVIQLIDPRTAQGALKRRLFVERNVLFLQWLKCRQLSIGARRSMRWRFHVSWSSTALSTVT